MEGGDAEAAPFPSGVEEEGAAPFAGASARVDSTKAA
jgi:hypothetical protein